MKTRGTGAFRPGVTGALKLTSFGFSCADFPSAQATGAAAPSIRYQRLECSHRTPLDWKPPAAMRFARLKERFLP